MTNSLNASIARQNGDIFLNSKKSDSLIYTTNQNETMHFGVTNNLQSSMTFHKNNIFFHGNVNSPLYHLGNFLFYDSFTPPKTLWFDARDFFITDGQYRKWYPRFETGNRWDKKTFLGESIRNKFIFQNNQNGTVFQTKDENNFNCIQFSTNQFLSLNEPKPTPLQTWYHITFRPNVSENQIILTAQNENKVTYFIGITSLNSDMCRIYLSWNGKTIHSHDYSKKKIVNKICTLSIKSNELSSTDVELVLFINGNEHSRMVLNVNQIDTNITQITIGKHNQFTDGFNGNIYDIVFDSQKNDFSILAFLLIKYKIKSINDIKTSLFLKDENAIKKGQVINFSDINCIVEDTSNQFFSIQKYIQFQQTVTVSLPGGDGMFQDDNAWESIMNAISYLHKFNGGTVFLFPGDYFIDRPIAFIHKETYEYPYTTTGGWDPRILYNSMKPYWIHINNIRLISNDKSQTKIINNNMFDGRLKSVFILSETKNITIENLTITGDFPDENDTNWYEVVPKMRRTYKNGWESGIRVKASIPDEDIPNTFYNRHFLIGLNSTDNITFRDILFDGKNFVLDESFDRDIIIHTAPSSKMKRLVGTRHCILCGGGQKNMVFERCTFQNFGWDVISDKDGSTRTLIKDCIALNNYSNFDVTGDNIVFENTTVDMKGRQWNGANEGASFGTGNRNSKISRTHKIVNCRVLNGVGINAEDALIENCYMNNCFGGMKNYLTLSNSIIDTCDVGIRKDCNHCEIRNCNTVLPVSWYGHPLNKSDIHYDINIHNSKIENCENLFASFSSAGIQLDDHNRTNHLLHRIQFQDCSIYLYEDFSITLPNRTYISKQDILNSLESELNKTKFKNIIEFKIESDVLVFKVKNEQLLCTINIHKSNLVSLLNIDTSFQNDHHNFDKNYPLSTNDQEYVISNENNTMNFSITISLRIQGSYQPLFVEKIIDTLYRISLNNMKNNMLHPIVEPKLTDTNYNVQRNMSNSTIILQDPIKNVYLPGNLTFYDHGFIVTLMNKSSSDIYLNFKGNCLFTLFQNTKVVLYYLNGTFHKLNDDLNVNNLLLESNKEPEKKSELGFELESDTVLIVKVVGRDGILRRSKIELV